MSQNVPDSLQMILHEEAGLRCAYCGVRDGLNLTHHHIVPREEGGTTSYENLIALCGDCHKKVHNGAISTKDIRRIKRILVSSYLSIPAVNALKLAATSGDSYVVTVPSLVSHLEEAGYLKEIAVEQALEVSVHWIPQFVTYKITQKGLVLYELWLKRSDD